MTNTRQVKKPTGYQTGVCPRSTSSHLSGSTSVIGLTYGLEPPRGPAPPGEREPAVLLVVRAPAPPGEREPAVVIVVRAADVHPTRGDQERRAQQEEKQRGKEQHGKKSPRNKRKSDQCAAVAQTVARSVCGWSVKRSVLLLTESPKRTLDRLPMINFTRTSDEIVLDFFSSKSSYG